MEITAGPLKGERHLIGHNEENGEGRVSTSIIALNKAIGQCLPKSGRTYTLVGPPGYDPDGAFVWQLYMAANDISAVRDVSAITISPS